jgi:hypothetical protein
MAVTIQVRNVPNTLHRKLKARATMAGLSLSDYLLEELRRAAELPTLQEMRERLERRPRPPLSMTTAEAVRAERDGR